MTAVALGGSGVLMLYYAGVVNVLLQQGVIKPGETPLGGISGGSAIAMMSCAGVSPEQQFISMKLVFAYCQVNYPNDPFCGGQGGTLLRQSVYSSIKAYGKMDALLRCRNKVYVAMSELSPKETTILKPEPWTVANPTSIDEMADLVAASSFLPCSEAAMAFTTFRGRPVLDGGYTSSFSHICPPQDKRCIKVSAFMVGANNPTGLLPNCTHDGPSPTFAPVGKPSGPMSNKLPLRGQWTLPDTCTYSATGSILAPEVPPLLLPGMPDIYPGNPHNALSIDPCEWQSWALNVQAMTPQNIMETYNQGANDAFAWLEANRQTISG